MSLWRARSNPLALWWAMLTLVSGVNIALWFLLYRELHTQPVGSMELMLLLCGTYVFGCAFRSVLPRADVQRICLFDTWLSSVLVGRSVATIAEVCFVAQWAIILHQLGAITGSDAVLNVAWIIVPLILIAECFSWYAVLTTNFLFNAIENSLWAVAFFLVGIGAVPAAAGIPGPGARRPDAVDRGHRRLSRLPRDRRRADVFQPLAHRASPKATSCSGCSKACVTSARAGSGRTTSPTGRARSPGCRCISAARSGRASRCASSIRSRASCRSTAPRRLRSARRRSAPKRRRQCRRRSGRAAQ